MKTRPASDHDLAAIRDLLSAAGLPSEDVALDLGPFVVAESHGGIVGTAGVQCLGTIGLLRSVAVTPAARTHGLATWLCGEVIEAACRRGVGELYLLTTSAPEFFAKLGFEQVPRPSAPQAVHTTREFRDLCPESSLLMHRRIDDPSASHAVALVRDAYEAFLRGEPEGLFALLDEKAVYHLPGAHLGGGALRGRAEIFQRAMAAMRAFDEPPSAVVLDAYGDDSLVITVERFAARRAARSLDQMVKVVWRLQPSFRCVELWAHFEDQAACDAFWAGW
jgi:amino-acid N-acetyltransferase